MSETFFIVKPDAVVRGLAGEVIRRIEAADFTVTRLKMTVATRPTVAMHYREHHGKPFLDALVGSMAGQTVVIGTAVHRESPDQSVELLRKLVGPYDPLVPGTIRGDLATDRRRNAIHASDSPEAARRETELWFENRVSAPDADGAMREAARNFVARNPCACAAEGRAGGPAPGR